MAAWANEQGGHDNITVVLGRLNDTNVNLEHE
jgi:serine/threonine protein phosphatase PrpC